MVVGFAVVHLLPLVPTAFWDLQPSVVSWVLAWLSAGAGLLLAMLALAATARARAGRHPGAAARRVRF